MHQCQNAGAEEMGDHRENPLTSRILRHNSHIRKSGSNPGRNGARTLGKAEMWSQRIYPGMCQSIVGALLASQTNIESKNNCFELFGADFILDEAFTPWLIEINSGPSMSRSTSVTARMCVQCLEDVIKVVIDRRTNRKADTGMFELIFKQHVTPAPPNLSVSLSVRGHSMCKADIINLGLYHCSGKGTIMDSPKTSDVDTYETFPDYDILPGDEVAEPSENMCSVPETVNVSPRIETSSFVDMRIKHAEIIKEKIMLNFQEHVNVIKKKRKAIPVRKALQEVARKNEKIMVKRVKHLSKANSVGILEKNTSVGGAVTLPRQYPKRAEYTTTVQIKPQMCTISENTEENSMENLSLCNVKKEDRQLKDKSSQIKRHTSNSCKNSYDALRATEVYNQRIQKLAHTKAHWEQLLNTLQILKESENATKKTKNSSSEKLPFTWNNGPSHRQVIKNILKRYHTDQELPDFELRGVPSLNRGHMFRLMLPQIKQKIEMSPDDSNAIEESVNEFYATGMSLNALQNGITQTENIILPLGSEHCSETFLSLNEVPISVLLIQVTIKVMHKLCTMIDFIDLQSPQGVLGKAGVYTACEYQ
ncbi:hypothetical protein PR048_031430 [Dryococelus australis]|uniref:Uncharacterized protein n=1 Tax=Dryococelus australis TaxID=614101 RepID=A0ABQ9G838_9NEOP|nr:hypothetical protein PR048_031430 [Dryococelus australis]